MALQRTWVMDAGSKFALKIAAKPLQIETCLLLTIYKNSLGLSPYRYVADRLRRAV